MTWNNWLMLPVLGICGLGVTSSQAAVVTLVETRLHSESGINVSQPVSPFSTVPNLSSSDYADVSSGNGVTGTVVNKTPDANSGLPSKLLDGLWPWDGNNDAPGESLFSNSSDFAFQIDLQSVVDIDQINVYTRHTNDRTDAAYFIYGSDAAVAPGVPATGAGPFTGWTLIESVDTVSGNSPDNTGTNFNGIAGISTFNDAGSLGQFRYLLFYDDSSRTNTDTFFGEVDIVLAAAVPEPQSAALTVTALLCCLALGHRKLRRRK